MNGFKDFEEYKTFLNTIFPWVKNHCNGDDSDKHYDVINKEGAMLDKKYGHIDAAHQWILESMEVIYRELKK